MRIHVAFVWPRIRPRPFFLSSISASRVALLGEPASVSPRPSSRRLLNI